ncbi:hypothetical protein O0L34_g19183 [Tuta absoluta]|nr:hypothetical protein O0L34_g19183 [Tuta absoluta]
MSPIPETVSLQSTEFDFTEKISQSNYKQPETTTSKSTELDLEEVLDGSNAKETENMMTTEIRLESKRSSDKSINKKPKTFTSKSMELDLEEDLGGSNANKLNYVTPESMIKEVEENLNDNNLILREYPRETLPEESRDSMQKENIEINQDVSEFHENIETSMAMRVVRNIKGQFQINPHKKKIQEKN